MENLPARCRPRAGVPQVHRMFSLPGRLSRPSRTRQKGTVRRPALLRSNRRPRNASAGRRQPRRSAQGSARPRSLQYNQMLHGSLSRGDSNHGQCHHSAQGARGGRILRPVHHALSHLSRPVARSLACAARPARVTCHGQGASMQHQLKSISKAGIPEAIAKAELYRYLNDPEEAESLCHDILAVDPEHQFAHRMLGLAITDQFIGAATDRYAEVQTIFQNLRDPYERHYYSGLLHERRAKAQLLVGYSPHVLLPLFEQPMRCFPESKKLSPAATEA